MCSKTVLASLFAFLGTSSALKLVDYTSQSEGMTRTVDLSEPITFKWEFVETDPETFGIELVNIHVYPPIKTKVISGINTDDGTYTVWNTDHIDPEYYGRGFEFNLVSESHGNTGILAQSSQFSASRSRPILVTPTSTPTPAPTTSTTTPESSTTPTQTTQTQSPSTQTVEEKEATVTVAKTETETTTATAIVTKTQIEPATETQTETEPEIEVETETESNSAVDTPTPTSTTIDRITVTQAPPGYAWKIESSTPLPQSGAAANTNTRSSYTALAVAFGALMLF